MDRSRVTKDVLCEEARFILANVLAEGRYGRQNRVEDIMRICEGAVSIPFRDYVAFLEGAGYLEHDAGKDTLDVTAPGERIVTGEGLSELRERASAHFRGGLPQGTPAPEVRPPGEHTATVHRGDTGMGKLPHYERLDVLGSGGIGQVVRARQVRLDRVVALKELHEPRRLGLASWDEAAERFEDVVKSTALLSHPNILTLLDSGINTDRPFVVTELVSHGSVRRLLGHKNTLPPRLVLKLTLQLLHALQSAHDAGVIHGSLKPENLLVDGSGNLRVSDFGMARVVEHTPLDGPSVFVGTGSVAYLAPELYREPDALSPEADLYAAGILFYEMLSGKLPGRRSSMPSKLSSELPAGVDDLFDRLCQDEVADRYSSAADVLADFAALDGVAKELSDAMALLFSDPSAELVRQAGAVEENVDHAPAPNETDDQSLPDDDKTSQVEAAPEAAEAKGSGARRRPSYAQRLRSGSKAD